MHQFKQVIMAVQDTAILAVVIIQDRHIMQVAVEEQVKKVLVQLLPNLVAAALVIYLTFLARQYIMQGVVAHPQLYILQIPIYTAKAEAVLTESLHPVLHLDLVLEATAVAILDGMDPAELQILEEVVAECVL